MNRANKNYKTSLFALFMGSLYMFMPAHAFEDCIVTAPAKLTDIKIEHNDVIDVFPLVTIMNDKNTLIVHPMKEGNTRFIVTKNGKEQVVFEVSVTSDETKINDVKGFDILTLDCPPGAYEYYFDLDEPPSLQSEQTGGTEIEPDFPPVLRERSK